MMTQQDENIMILLANRSYLYRLLQRTFGEEPDASLMQAATCEHTQEAISLLFEEGDKNLEQYLQRLTKLQEKLQQQPEETLGILKSEYTYYLIGPGKMPAPPWESVYLSSDHLLFQESTLKVRRTYLKYDFLPSNYPREADDHLALELDFMANLALQTEELFKERKLADMKELLTGQKSFLDEHLGNWIGKFAEKIQAGKTHHFYPWMASLAEQVVAVDQELIDEIVTVV